MAHQAHAIPWKTLADNLVYLHCNPRNHGVTNLYLRKNKDPNQAKQIRHFVRGFASALSAYSVIERQKYELDPTPPGVDDIIISDAAVKRMSMTIMRYKSHDGNFTMPQSLDDILPPCERSAARFIRDTMPGEGDMDDGIQDACEETKTLLMYGEMDTLLRLAAHPDVYFGRLWCEEQYANSHGFGLCKLLDAALQAYICLNVITLKPELYDAASIDTFIRVEKSTGRITYENEQYDYRLTAAYQNMLLLCTGLPYGLCEAHTFPHREFFGVRRGQYRFSYDDTQYGRWQKRNLGTQRVEALSTSRFQGVHAPSRVDVAVVLNLLGQKGLPGELALKVVDWAEYVPVGRLPISSNPLHIANDEELRKYISYCWKLLVRLDILCRVGVNGGTIDWEAEVNRALFTLFDMPGRSFFADETTPYGCYSGMRRSKILVV